MASAPPERLAVAVLRGTLGVLLLQFLFSYANVVSTPWVEPRWSLALEVTLGLGLWATWRTRARRLESRPRWRWMFPATSVVVTLAFLRYVDVTAPGVMGRSFDLQADLPHIRNVASMFRTAMDPGQEALITGGIAALFVLLFLLVLAALRSIQRALDIRGFRRTLVLLALAAGVVFPWTARSQPANEERVGWRERDFDPWQGKVDVGIEHRVHHRGFAEPLTTMLARWMMTLEKPGALRLTANTGSSLTGLAGEAGWPDIVVIFLESYGATLLDDPQHRPYIEDRFDALERNLAGAGFSYRSIQAQSPTFAGGSWRAHATLLSGVRIENQRLYEALLASRWTTLPSLLAQNGYRTVAAEPGIQKEWPEGEWWNFDQIYDAPNLAYRGAPIGWWKIPDQYTVWKIWNEELRPSRSQRRPVFAKISLIMSHIPYVPLPPYIDDWQTIDGGSAWSQMIPSVGADDYRDMTELSIRYVAAFRHELDVIEGFLIQLADPNTLVIVAGDHQPPKLATHDSDSWAVPLHVISRRHDLVDAFASRGLAATMLPAPGDRYGLEDFFPDFCEVFDG